MHCSPSFVFTRLILAGLLLTSASMAQEPTPTKQPTGQPAKPVADAEPPAQPVATDPVVIGEGKHRYTWYADWAKSPKDPSADLGNTHGCMCVDSKGNLYVNTDTEHAVVVYRPDGSVLRSWGKELARGLHGMTIRKEGDEEFLYLAHIGRHQVLKTKLDGEVLWTLGYPKASGIYKDANQYRPTGIAVADNGDLYVADGYGLSWVHHFDARRRYVRSFGGRGDLPGRFKTPHGIRLDNRGEVPELWVADRENHRLQVFDLDGNLLRVIEGMLRRPCNTDRHGDLIVVADLAGRATLIDPKGKLVAQLGDQPDPKLRAKNGIPREQWRDGQFLSPHSACFDGSGNLFVMDWNRHGRVTKLQRHPD